MRKLALAFVALTALLGPALGWSQYPEADRTGVIHAIELDRSSVIVSGWRYRVPLGAHVEIDGTYGALELLREGMKVRFTYRVISNVEREIVRLETLPPGTVIEEV